MNKVMSSELVAESEGSLESSPKVMLIDLENCPKQLQNLPADINHYQRVVICHAHAQAKIPLGWISLLAEAVVEKRLSILKMEKGGKNAADFGICFLAGALMQELPDNTHFVIVSNDTDLDHAVNLLQGHQRSAERIGLVGPAESGNQQATQAAVSVPETDEQRIADFCVFLQTQGRSQARPAKPSTLQNSIKSRYRLEQQAEVVRLYKEMISSGVFCIVNKQIQYSESRINILARSRA